MLDTCRIQCPYCGESMDLTIDNNGDGEEYIDDCQICCRPMVVQVTIDANDGRGSVVVRRDDE